jgi:hypothetical protein
MRTPSSFAIALILTSLSAAAAEPKVLARLSLDLNNDGKPDFVRVLDPGTGDFNILEISYSRYDSDQRDVHTYAKTLPNERGSFMRSVPYSFMRSVPYVVELKKVVALPDDVRLEITSTQDEGTRGSSEKLLIAPGSMDDGVLRIESNGYEHHAGDPSPSFMRMYDFEHQFSASWDDPGDRRDDRVTRTRVLRACNVTLKQYDAKGLPKCAQ